MVVALALFTSNNGSFFMHYKKFLLATSSIVFFPDQNICPLTSPQPRLMGLFFASAGFQSGAI